MVDFQLVKADDGAKVMDISDQDYVFVSEAADSKSIVISTFTDENGRTIPLEVSRRGFSSVHIYISNRNKYSTKIKGSIKDQKLEFKQITTLKTDVKTEEITLSVNGSKLTQATGTKSTQFLPERLLNIKN